MGDFSGGVQSQPCTSQICNVYYCKLWCPRRQRKTGVSVNENWKEEDKEGGQYVMLHALELSHTLITAFVKTYVKS